MSEAHLRLVDDRPPSIPPADPLVGRTLDGRYRIESVLGEGGMGLVYRARHAVLNKPLAIKVLRPEVSRDAEVMGRFQQEAQSASAIGNHHIIDISDFGTLPDGATYFVMEFLDGVSLTKAIEEQRPIAPSRVVKIAKQLCDALGAAHERSIVHRDLKPDNIYLIKRGQDPDFVKVLDFGIAKVGGSSSKLTKAGQVFGTPHYMSPEQCAGSNVDARTDVYALGVILYEMSSGRVPFDADNLMGILTKHMYEQPIPPRELPPPTDVPPGLEAVIMKCLAKSPEARYQSMAEMHADLERLEAGLTPQAVVDAVDRASGMRRDATGRLVRDSAMRIGVGGVAEGAGRSPVLIAMGVAAVLVILGGGGFIAYRMMEPPAVPRVTQLPPRTTETPPAADTPPTTTTAVRDPESTTAGTTGTGVGTTAGTTAGTAAGTTEGQAAAPVRIESDPPGAEVLVDGLVLGVTPLDVPRPVAGRVSAVTLRLRGYRDEGLGVTEFSSAVMQRTLTRAGSVRRPDTTSVSMEAAAMEAVMETVMETSMRSPSGGPDGLVDPWQ